MALATRRPLLLRGEPGTGKSSFAAFMARQLNWSYYEHVVTSRTQAQDLLWTFDLVRRLADAQVGRLKEPSAYLEPGVLWWAFAPRSAAAQGAGNVVPRSTAQEHSVPAEHPSAPRCSVVLIDEIDKADPDVPNSLLVPLGSHSFTVSHTGTVVRAEAGGASPTAQGSPLIILTTNEERELPTAFLRRCVAVVLPEPTREQLLAVAGAHLNAYEGGARPADMSLADELAHTVISLREEAKRNATRPPSTAEYLDALDACRRLGITPRSEQWQWLKEMALVKTSHLG
ncbi:AAA family ATPase [Streptomyces sp. NPDC096132]|uniref:AAA family ATPase n=1 Tax=Streptomyces sp. NPDC096132 TaxID=3366075 RepID=UPI00380EA668